MSFVKQVYMIDITQIPDNRKWYKFFKETYEDSILNDTAFNIGWDEFGLYDDFFDNSDLNELQKEFRQLLINEGVPDDPDVDVWLNFWW